MLEPFLVFLSIYLTFGIPLIQNLPRGERAVGSPLPSLIARTDGTTTEHLHGQEHEEDNPQHNECPKKPHPTPRHHRAVSIHHGVDRKSTRLNSSHVAISY